MRSLPQQQALQARAAQFISSLSDAERGEIATLVVGKLDEECARKLRSGRRDLFGSIASVRPAFLEHLTSQAPVHGLSARDLEDRPLAEAVFQRCVKWLAEEGEIIFSSDRIRARGRVFEVAHYLRHLRQRTPRGEQEGSRPELVEMLKVEVEPRVRPVRSRMSPSDFVATTRDLEYLDDPLPCDEDFQLSGCYERIARLFTSFLSRAFEDFAPAQFQTVAFRELLRAAYSGEMAEDAPGFVIAAGTGFGKTEAFLFPLLFHAVYSKIAKIEAPRRGRRKPEGVDGLLLYPRRDLCDNQTERLLGYLFHLNGVLRADLGDSFQPIKVALAHSNIRELRIRCPACDADKQADPPNWTLSDEQNAYVEAIPDPKSDYMVQGFHCTRREPEHAEVCSYLVYQTFASSEPADLVVTTLDTLNRRLMDGHGQPRIFGLRYLPRFVVVDEMHIYEGQSGSHAANILRRCRQRIKYPNGLGNDPIGRPVFVGASATAGRPRETGARMFGLDEEDVTVIQPGEEEKKRQGIEYFLFLKTPGNRLVQGSQDTVLSGDLEDDPDDGVAPAQTRSRFVSEQATMIQAAFCLQHTMRTRGRKRRTLGFVDSIDVAQRLSGNIHDPEWSAFEGPVSRKLPLYAYRYPAGRSEVSEESTLMDRVRSAGSEFFERDIASRPLDGLGAGCPRRFQGTCTQPPHHLLDPCKRYEQGECWWTMAAPAEEGLQPIPVQLRRSGHQAWGEVGRRYRPADRDRWRLLVATSTLEVGFDHDELIATWQYHAPPSVSSFVQRKGRGGRGIRDFPITLVVLGPSADDSYFFQNHLRLVQVAETDIVSYVDQENPSLRSQHVVGAVYDLCAAQRYTQAFKGPDFQLVLSSLEDARVWAAQVFPDMRPDELNRVIGRLRSYVLDVLDDDLVPLAPAGKPVPRQLRPVDLFRQDRDEVTTYLTLVGERLRQLEGASETERLPLMRSRQWALEAQSFHQSRSRRGASVVQFFESIPRALEDAELRLPTSTIPEPLGRTLRAHCIDGNRTTLAAEPAEFLLRTFLPGGFKIRYDGKLWMGPWEAVPGKPPVGNRMWVEAAKYIHEALRQNIPNNMEDLLDAASEEVRERLLTSLTPECRVIPVSGLDVHLAGPGRSRSFQLDRETLQIYPRKPDNVPAGRLRRLVRDPHLTSRKFVLVMQGEDDTRAYLDDMPRTGLFSEAVYHPRLSLVVGHYANLVHCYPDDGDVVTLALNFWDRANDKPVCVAAPETAQAVEFTVDCEVISKSDWNDESLERAFWRRVQEDLVDDLIVEQGRLDNAYLVSGLVEVLRSIEIELHGCLGRFRSSPPSGADLVAGSSAIETRGGPTARAYRREIQAVVLHSEPISRLIRSALAWSEEHGPVVSLGDSLVAGLTRLAANKLRISPGSFRRLVERSGDELSLFLYDDFEGGGGNARRLAEELESWEGTLMSDLSEALSCPAAIGDEHISEVFLSDYTTDALVILSRSGALPFEWANLPVGARSVSRLERLLESPEIAAFYRYAYRTRRHVRSNLGGEPPPLHLLTRIYERPALDPRAEALRLRFSEGSTPELPARLAEVAPLCLAGCPECLHADRFDPAFIDRPFVQHVVERLAGDIL